MTNNVYPSLDELMPPELLIMIPDKLADEVRERYSTLGGKYLTESYHTDGRRINGMMYTDRIENCIEEIVDAVFCILGQIFKDNVRGKESDENIFPVLSGLVQIYSLLSLVKMHGTYN